MQLVVQNKISMHSMLMLEGWGACPQKNLKSRSSEIEFKGISGS